MNGHAAPEQDAPQAANNERRLHRSAVLHERAGTKRWRIAPCAHLIRGGRSQLVRSANLGCHANHLFADGDVLGRGRGEHIACPLDQASTPWASQNSPMDTMLSEIARQARTAASAPYRAMSPPSSSHHPLANPPLRPLGPRPQMS